MLPHGVTWGQYFRHFAAAMLTALIGSQAVHAYYRPLDDLDTYIQKELDLLPVGIRQKVTKLHDAKKAEES